MPERFLALSDLDGTVLANPPIMIGLAEYQADKLAPGSVNRINRLLSAYLEGKFQYEDFAQRLLAFYAEALRGKNFSLVVEETRRFINERVSFYPVVAKLFAQLQKTHDLYFVTASPQFIAGSVVERFGARGSIASIFEVIDGCFTGNISSSLAKGEDKKSAIQELIARYPETMTVGLGDTEADEPMLSLVELPLCVNPNPVLREIAQNRNWKIIQDPNNEDFKPGEWPIILFR